MAIFYPEDFGALIDNSGAGTTNSDAFSDMLDAMSDGDVAQLSAGIYTMGSTWVIDKKVTVRGVEPPHHVNEQLSAMFFGTNMIGIQVNAKSTFLDLYLNAPFNTTADASKPGIYCTVSVVVGRCRIEKFPGSGIYLDGIAGNTNHWYVFLTRCANNLQSGFHANGENASVGIGLRLDCVNNAVYGVHEDAFEGNTYINCHTSGNNSAGYYATNNSGKALFLNCYAEQGQGSGSVIDYPSMRVLGAGGPFIGSGANIASSIFDIRTVRPIEFDNQFDDDNRVWAKMGGGAGYIQQYQAEQNVDGSGVSRPYIKHFRIVASYLRWFITSVNGSTSQVIEAESGYGADVGVGQKWFPPGIYFGGSVGGVSNPRWKMDTETRGGIPVVRFQQPNGTWRAIGWASAAPSSGTWTPGDIIYNSAPSTTAPAFWMCTSAPATFRAGPTLV